MKLLGWMNQKLRQNSTDPLRNLSLGSNSCLLVQSDEEQQYHLRPNKISAHTKHTKSGCTKYSTCPTANKEESSFITSDLFHGFLTIGTLGSEPITAEPTTPRFAITFENEKEKETDVTDEELKLINDELEKFLEAEAKEVDKESSARSSYVSIITLSGNQIEGLEVEENKPMLTCPPQGYHFGSSIEWSETGDEMKKEKGTLEELFRKHSIGCIAYQQDEQQGKKQGQQSKGTYAMHFIKKMLKKIPIPSKNSATSVNGHASHYVTTKRKLPKALRMLHRRIHPERSSSEEKITMSQISEKNFSHKSKHQDIDVTLLRTGNQMCMHTNKEIRSMSLYHNSFSGSHSTATGEHWIKTDAEYLVLEL